MSKVKDEVKKKLAKKEVKAEAAVKKDSLTAKVVASYYTQDKLKKETLSWLDSIKITQPKMRARIGLAYERNGELTQNDIRTKCGDTCSQVFSRLCEVGVAYKDSSHPYHLCFNKTVSATSTKQLDILQPKKSLDANAALRYANDEQQKLLNALRKSKK